MENVKPETVKTSAIFGEILPFSGHGILQLSTDMGICRWFFSPKTLNYKDNLLKSQVKIHFFVN